jgi:uncharacterized protein YdeI (YjbR/CyaY-like superfamily)
MERRLEQEQARTFFVADAAMGELEMVEQLYLSNRNDWRAWLEKNYATEKQVWLIYYKKHAGKPSIPYEDSLEEALCFGWIDGIIKRIDDERCARKFIRRRSSSRWSKSNKERAEKMISLGRMTEAGMARIDEAKKSGEWFKPNVVPKDLMMPSFIEEALMKNKKASENFNRLARSYKRLYVRWICSAKREETRLRRLEEAIDLLEQNKKLGLK